ncbi:MAG TPA: DUF1800 domain-containing protein [Blastocatellia bacterium]|nr:DUF1800 domain-containing protein [Blastocatellia bacterium]
MASLTYDEAAHLLRRMGFGGPPEEIDALAGRGREGAVDYLIAYQQADNQFMEDQLRRGFDFSDPTDFSRFNRGDMQRWWFTRMVYTARPFEEKMTLFWHNHFATAASKVPEIFLFTQNQLLRNNALARFDNLLLAVAQDPAMLIWLDGLTNVAGRPNENFARELQELFTMGIRDAVTGEANYTEDDVKEVARAFTGWKFFHPRDSADPYDYRFFLNPPEHDNTAKTVYAGTPYQAAGNLNGDDIIQLICARRATARFLVWKLFKFFVYPLTDSDADRATVEKFAGVYLNNNHSIKELVRAIFASDEFFSDRARFALVKSPVELIVGGIRMLGAIYNYGTSAFQDNANLPAILSLFLGQELFNPPDVAGWRLGLDWINTSTLLNRFTFANFLAATRPAFSNQPGIYLTTYQLGQLTGKKSKKVVNAFLTRLGPLSVDGATTRALIDYLEKDDAGNVVGFRRSDQSVDKKIRGLIHLIMCLSEFQLN